MNDTAHSLHAPDSPSWAAPRATGPLDATVRIPGSKSLTNRELVLAALADDESRIRGALDSRDATLMRDGLTLLGAQIVDDGDALVVSPIADGTGQVAVDCGLAGTAMRFLPLVAALGSRTVTFDGDPHARVRPMRGTIAALRALGVRVDDEDRGTLPFTVHGTGGVDGGRIEIDASVSSQFVTAVLLAAPRFARGVELVHTGDRLPSQPHIDMTIEALRARGVDARTLAPGHWSVAPGPIAALESVIEPDLSNAAPFLAAAVVAGGTVRIPDWPAHTTQPGGRVPELLAAYGARVTLADGLLSVDGGRGLAAGPQDAVPLDLTAEGELTPTLAALALLLRGTTTITGVGHIRGHETDRIRAIVDNAARVGVVAHGTDDGLEIDGAGDALPLRAREVWRAESDHRLATAGALVGLVTEGLEVDDIGSTSKTMPTFPELWREMLGA